MAVFGRLSLCMHILVHVQHSGRPWQILIYVPHSPVLVQCRLSQAVRCNAVESVPDCAQMWCVVMPLIQCGVGPCVCMTACRSKPQMAATVICVTSGTHGIASVGTVWFLDLMQDTKFESVQAPPLGPSGPATILCAQATQRNIMQLTTNSRQESATCCKL
jgi:hypothetical protein